MSKGRVLLWDCETMPNIAAVWGKYEQDVLWYECESYMFCFAYKWLGERRTRVISLSDFKSYKRSPRDDKPLTPRPYKQIDTLKVARKNFRLNSNKLDDLARVLGVGRKERTGGIDLWYDVYHNDAKAIKKMLSYNIQDVNLLERVYLKQRPWIPNHPHIGLLENRLDACPNCGKGPVVKNGSYTSRAGRYQVWRCQNCQAHPRSRLMEKAGRPAYV